MLRAACAIAFNDLRILSRNGAALFFTFGFPVAFALFFSMVMRGMSGGSGKLDVALVDLDRTEASRTLAADMSADDGLSVRTPDASAGPRSPAEELEAARTLVRRGKVAALVIIPEGFGSTMGGLFAGQPIRLEAEVDPSRNAEAGLLTGKLNQLAFKQLSSAFTEPARMDQALNNARSLLAKNVDSSTDRGKAFGSFYDSLGGLSRELEKIRTEDKASAKNEETASAAGSNGKGFSPIDVEIRKLTSSDKAETASPSDIAFPQGMAWGLMSCVVGFASSFAAERRRGTLVRLSTAPLSRASVLAGKMLGGFLATAAVMIVLVAGAIAMGTRVANWPFMVAIILCSSIGFVGFSLALASFATTEEGAGGIGRAIPMILAMIGGGTIPLAFMPETFRRVSDISPFKWAIYGVEGAIWRGLTPAEFAIPCVILLGLGAVSFVVGVKRLSWAE